MTLNDEDKIILYDYGNKDYKTQVAAAKSFQDIVNVFEVCFPGTADKYQSFAAFTGKVKVTVATIQDPLASPEAQYDAIEQWDNYRSGSMVDALKTFDGFDYMGFIAQKEEIRRKLPEKMLDSYIITAQDMTVRMNSIKAKEAAFRAVAQQITDIQDAIIKKYALQHKEADAKFKEVMDVFNAWHIEMGQGNWQKAKNGEKYRPWSEESVAAFNAQYRAEISEWQAKLLEATNKYKSPVYDAEAKEMSEATEELFTKQNALKAELDQAKQEVYDVVINSILATSPVSEEQAAEWSKGNVIYDKSAMSKSAKNGYGKKDIERDVQLFYRLTGGRLPRLEFTTTRQARSCAAHWSGELFIGHNFGRRTLWHEMAHLLEDDPKIKAAAIAFRDRRREDSKLHRLKDLVPGSNYQPREVAYKDSWIDPYIGKDYGQTATEVVSMGMQQLASIPAMFELHEKDPEHLAFMLGLCMTKPVIDTEAVAKKQATTQGKVAKANTQEQFLKDLDKQVAKAGDFWSADGYSVEETRSYSYKSGKYVTRAEIKYNLEYDDEGKLKRYSSYTLKSVKAAKRALFLWYQAGKPVSNSVITGSTNLLNLGNIVYQLERSTKELPDYILQTPLSGA